MGFKGFHAVDRKHTFGTSINFCDIHSISKNLHHKIFAETVEKPSKHDFKVDNFLILLHAKFEKIPKLDFFDSLASYLQRTQIDTSSEKVQFFSLCFYLT
jgi:hypothetical protein